MWLERRHAEKRQTEHGLYVLRQAGLVLEGARQRALAEAMRPTRRFEGEPSRAQVEVALSRLQVPLSEEIPAMRDARGCCTASNGCAGRGIRYCPFEPCLFSSRLASHQ